MSGDFRPECTVRLDAPAFQRLVFAAGRAAAETPTSATGLLVGRNEGYTGWDRRLRPVLGQSYCVGDQAAKTPGDPPRDPPDEHCWGGAACCLVLLPTAASPRAVAVEVFDWELVRVDGEAGVRPGQCSLGPAPPGSGRSMFGDFRVPGMDRDAEALHHLRRLGFRFGPAVPVGLLEPLELWRPVWSPPDWAIGGSVGDIHCTHPSTCIAVTGRRP